MNQFSIWQSENFVISQARDFPLLGYLFVECITEVDPKVRTDLMAV